MDEQERAAALERLTGPHWQAAYGLILRLLRSAHSAEDVLQETLVKAMRHLEDLREPDKAKAWLLRIAHNTALNWIAQHRASVSVGFAEDVDALPGATAVRSPESSIVRRHEAQWANELVLQLPPIYRSILLLRLGEGLSYAEMATTLGIPEGTAKFRVHQGLALLRRKVDEARLHATKQARPEPAGAR
jgi:RNA polymerase sigma-70 factor (ECF subfamily)